MGILRRHITSTGSASRLRRGSSTSSLRRLHLIGSASGRPGRAGRSRTRWIRWRQSISKNPPEPRGRRPERAPPAHSRLAVAGHVRLRPRLPSRSHPARMRPRARRNRPRRPASVNRWRAPGRQETKPTAAEHGPPLAGSRTVPWPRLRPVPRPLARTKAHCPLRQSGPRRSRACPRRSRACPRRSRACPRRQSRARPQRQSHA